PSKRMLIESDIIERNVAKLFVVQSAEYEEDHIMKGCNYSEPSDVEDFNYDSLRLECLSQFYILTLNGDTLNPDYLPTKDRALGRSGLVAYVDLSHLPKGKHEIHLLYNFLKDDGSKSPGRVADIEFYKSVPAEPLEPPKVNPGKLDNSSE
ncbi:MAG TPA: hypothetical protein VJ894_07790, partial [Cryomorphaceae bacterium]|nr:hypothetical protein [Cryomorphaceae bacterium]